MAFHPIERTNNWMVDEYRCRGTLLNAEAAVCTVQWPDGHVEEVVVSATRAGRSYSDQGHMRQTVTVVLTIEVDVHGADVHVPLEAVKLDPTTWRRDVRRSMPRYE